MYVCLCNPFTDRDVKAALDTLCPGEKKTAGAVYKACTGGQKPCCGSCVCVLKEMVANHNNAASLADVEPANLLAAE